MVSFKKFVHCAALLSTCLMSSAYATTGTVQFSFSTGWVTGVITGLAAGASLDYTLAGSFAEGSTATITFNDPNPPTLVVDPVNPPVGAKLQDFSFDFSPGALTGAASAPLVVIKPATTLKYTAPVLTLFAPDGSVSLQVQADGASMVPEPSAWVLALAGLLALPVLARRLPAADRRSRVPA